MKHMRPLTMEEQLYATQNHNLVYTFLHENGYSIDTYYDVAIFGYIRAVQEYMSLPRFRVYAFSTIAWRRMQCSITNYKRYLDVPKRSASIISLSAPLDAESGLTWGDVLSKPDPLFLKLETEELLHEMAQRLPPEEMKLIRLKMRGHTMHEIAAKEHLTFREINTLLAKGKENMIQVLWGEDHRISA